MNQNTITHTSISTSLRSRLNQGIAWNVVGSVFSSGSSFLFNIIIANILGREAFGEFGMIQSTILTVSGIAQLATGYTATKYVAEFRSVDKEKTGRIIGLCSAIAALTAVIAVIVLFFGAPWLAAYTFKASHLTLSLMIATGTVLFAVMNGYQIGALAGLESYRAMAKALIISSIFNLAIGGLGAWLYGFNGVIAAMVVTALFQWLIFRRVLNVESAAQGITIYLRGIIQEERAIFLKFTLPAAISGFFSMPALWLANAFLVRQPAGFSQMALYSAANSMRSLVLFLPLIFNRVGMSLLNNQKGLKDDDRYRKVFWANMAITAGSVLTGAIVIALLGPWLLSAFGKDFKEGYPVLLVMLLAATFEGLTQAFYQVIQSQEKMWLSLWAIVLPRDGSTVLLAYLLIPLYGAIGLAWAYVTASFLALCIVSFLSWHIGLNAK